MSSTRVQAPTTGTPHSSLRGLVEVGAASVLWGTGGLAVQLIREREAMSPVTISVWRMTLAAVVLIALVLLTRRLGQLATLARRHPGRVLVVGAGTAAYQLLYFISVTQAGVAVATLVSLGIAPVLLTLLDSLRTRSAPTPARLAVLVTALSGLVLVSLVAGHAGTGPDPRTGVLLAIASGTTYAVTTAASGPVSRFAGPLVLTSAMTLVGAVVLLPTLLLVSGPLTTDDPVALAWLIYLGLPTMALAYVLLYSALRVTAASTAVTASLLEPVTAALVAAVVLDEPLGVGGVIGTVLVLAAVAGLGRTEPEVVADRRPPGVGG